MPIPVSYPGVYVQELSSGVRTITGVSTSLAMFVGFTSDGPLNQPKLLLSFSDYEREFGSDTSQSEMATQVRLFFQNGGERCYVMRIAENATNASLTMSDVTGAPTLRLLARQLGAVGNRIRAEVDYATPTPDETFNLSVFIETEATPGQFSRSAEERHVNLSMNPQSSRYVLSVLERDSALVRAEDLHDGASPGAGISYSDRLFTSDEDLREFIITEADDEGHALFELSLDGGASFTAVRVDSARNGTGTELLQAAIEHAFDDEEVAVVEFVDVAEADSLGAIRIRAQDSDHSLIIRAVDPTVDIAGPLGLGVNQGGIESHYGPRRPAPTGSFLVPEDQFLAPEDRVSVLNTLAIRNTSDLTSIEVDEGTQDSLYSVSLSVGPDDEQLHASGVTAFSSYSNVRNKLEQIANAVNSEAAASGNFNWTAHVEGAALILRPSGRRAANFSGPVTLKNGDDTLHNFHTNARYYSVGPDGAPNTFQSGVAGSGGSPPSSPQTYADAYELIDAEVDIFNLLVLPAAEGVNRQLLWGDASVFCQKRRAFLLVDPPAWVTVQDILTKSTPASPPTIGDLRTGLVTDHAAVYWPRLSTVDAVTGLAVRVDPAGAVAGVMARIDASRGVWKAAAGIEADIRGVQGLERKISDPENGIINPEAVNALRVFPNGIVVWGARTMDGFDNSGNTDYKYTPVRRLALYIEESLLRGLKFAVFEPNGEELWAQIRLAAGAFMNNLFRQGGLAGTKASDAYFVRCDSTTTTQNDINLGIVNVVIGFAPLKPAEFVIITLQQKAGDIQV